MEGVWLAAGVGEAATGAAGDAAVAGIGEAFVSSARELAPLPKKENGDSPGEAEQTHFIEAVQHILDRVLIGGFWSRPDGTGSLALSEKPQEPPEGFHFGVWQESQHRSCHNSNTVTHASFARTHSDSSGFRVKADGRIATLCIILRILTILASLASPD